MAYLTLSDGTVYEGIGFGYEGDTIGEVIFNTGMTGYQELLTDPSYVGQIVNMTYPLIGNYGVNASDIESDSPKVKGFVVRDYCEVPSNWHSEGTLDNYLKANKIVALRSIDTRALTRKIRSKGTMVGIISQQLPSAEQMLALGTYKISNPVQEITTKEPYDFVASKENQAKLLPSCGMRVAVLDYGLKKNILESLAINGLSVRVYPSTWTAEQILAENPDGILLTNGPGDPKDNAFEIEQLKKLIGKKPIFGICLGHQLLALAHGGNTVKLAYGHRGSNHPVMDTEKNRVYITSQNHGYTVEAESLADKGKITHINWNDRTVEGIRYNDGITFSVQFHPEARPGPEDTSSIFDDFKALMRRYKEGK